MTQRALAAVLVLALSALAAPPVRAADTCSQQARRVRLPEGFAEASVSFQGVLAGGGTRVGEEFPAGQGLREVRIVVTWSDLESVHQQRLALYSPQGNAPEPPLYQQFVATFTGDPRRPVAVTTHLPVAGSSITDSSLYGEWCVEVYLDGEDAPIARHRLILDAP